jgi:hypothetical protein
MDTILDKIETIFQEKNIYKSIFVSPPTRIDALYDILVQNDFPVSKLVNINDFKNNKSRILLIDVQAAEDFGDFADMLPKDDINTVICLDYYEHVNGLENVFHIFL